MNFIARGVAFVLLTLSGLITTVALGQPLSPLEESLRALPAEQLGAEAVDSGNARRGAMLFYHQRLACAKCHIASGGLQPLGPLLEKPAPDDKITPTILVEALLHPSKRIRKSYQPVLLRLDDGRQVRGLILDENDDEIKLRDIAREGAVVRIDKENIEARKNDETSLMPTGLVGHLGGKQQFFDLVKYLHEIATHGPERVKELQPPLGLMGIRPLPEYEGHIDHEGILTTLDDQALKRGEQIYSRLCINCHGTHDRPGSLPTSLRFSSGKFKRGSDPYSMYLTLTHGFGQMVAQTWMAPTQKYDVIHYIRERYLKSHNPSQYFAVSERYLASLPIGDTRGPAPVKFEPWATMNYGPTLTHTYEVGNNGKNFAYKGIAVRLDPGPGGISQGQRWMIFDEDTLRWAVGWSGKQFIDWNGIMFNGRHGIHPRVTGKVGFENPTGPGWSNPASEGISLDDPRIRGRDDRPYGPLPRRWAQFKGLHHFGNQAIVSYTVDSTTVLEMPGADSHPELHDAVVFQRSLNVGPRAKPLHLTVARAPKGTSLSVDTLEGGSVSVARLGKAALGDALGAAIGAAAEPRNPNNDKPLRFDGGAYVELSNSESFHLTGAAYTVAARVKTNSDGVIFAKTVPGPKWAPNCKALFVRSGRLTFDVGWVGAVAGKTKINDGRWHDVAMTCDADGKVTLYVDGKIDGEGTLPPKGPEAGHVVRFGYAASNFPRNSKFRGQIERISFHPTLLSKDAIQKLGGERRTDVNAPARQWHLTGMAKVADTHGKSKGEIVRGQPVAADAAAGVLVAATTGLDDATWSLSAANDLMLTIPAGSEPLRFTLRIASSTDPRQGESLENVLRQPSSPMDLQPLLQGGPANWGAPVATAPFLGDDSGPFAFDVLTRPAGNPWLARARLTGFDFFDGGDRAAVCAWDGDVWIVSGLNKLDGSLEWRRIASGMFQPLGLKIVEGDIYVSCRDQITILRDFNDDGETDFYETFNNDHQVTEHFHEFAMGLQRDDKGNFYYAKSARHALPALVPHHGTLLRVSPDGHKTDILATGFRAANGVCLNPDGSFIVTDQEGHWNPKNRINWVREGGFYGNMYGYHDITDSSDEAMQQPLCWITNSFDRSPAELLWVDSERWGPLNGSLLNLSYGYGKIFIVPHETKGGQVQGGMVQLPIPDAPTGLIRGRFHPGDGQLYACGMFSWAGSRQQPGGFYRVRYTGKPVHLPVGLAATPTGMRLTFSGGLDPKIAEDPSRYQVKVWSLKRTKNYGSKHFDEKPLTVKSARIVSKGRVVELVLEGMKPTWCMEIKYQLQGAGGESVQGVLHNTVHKVQ